MDDTDIEEMNKIPNPYLTQDFMRININVGKKVIDNEKNYPYPDIYFFQTMKILGTPDYLTFLYMYNLMDQGI